MTKALNIALFIFLSIGSGSLVLAQADRSTHSGTESKSSTTSQTQEEGSEVMLSIEELKSIVSRIQRVRASRSTMQPIYYYAPQTSEAVATESNAVLEARMARIEESLDILIRNAGAQPPSPVQPQTIVVQQAAKSDTSTYVKEMQLLQREIAQLRADLSSTQARLDAKSTVTTQPSEIDTRVADNLRDLQTQQEARDREARKESERLRDEIRDLEKSLSKRTTVVAAVPVAKQDARVDTVVQVSTPDTALANMLLKQDAQLKALQAQLAANEAARQKPAPEPTIVYRDREVVRQADPIRVTDTLRIEKTIERTAAPRIIDVSAVLFSVGSSTVETRNDVALSQASDAYRQRLGTVQLRGWSSPEGNAASNRQLSLKRAKAVRDELVLRGVPPTAIRILDGGIDTESLSRNVARRVEIQLLVN